MEKEHKELAEKAKQYLGITLYHDLSRYNNAPMKESDEDYNELIKKSKKLNEEFEKEMGAYLKHIRSSI
jgi:hypothetical protein